MRRSGLVVSGGGRFGDPWHPFAETTQALVAALEARDLSVRVDDDADRALAALTDGPPDLLVINIGWYGPEAFEPAAADGLVAALRAGTPTFVVHSSITAFPEWPLWREIVGGGWVYGTTYHPDYGEATALPSADHPVTAGLGPLAVVDERYTLLSVADEVAVYLEHDEAGARHPLAWTHTWAGAPIMVDALGHDAAAYEAPGRAALLQRELDHLLGLPA